MRFYIYFVVYIYLRRHAVEASLSDNANLENYLQAQMMSLSVKQEVRLKRNTTELSIDLFDFHDDKDEWKFAYSFTLFNESYVMLDRDFYKIFRGKFMILTPILEAVEEEKRITKAKMIEIGDLGILVVVIENKLVRIVKFEGNVTKYQDVQTMEHAHVSDVSFFQNQGNLHLIVSNEKGNNFVPVSIYQWKDSQFDEQKTILEKGITQIKTFTDEGKEIILMLQEKRNNTSFCIVFEFENQSLNKRQVISVDGPRFILPYKIDDDCYVVFMNSLSRIIYKWNGYTLVEWSIEEVSSSFERVFMIYLNNTPIIFATYLNKFVAYKPTHERIEYLKTMYYRHEFTEMLDLGHVKKNESDILSVVGNIEDTGMIEIFKVEFSHLEKEMVPPLKDPLYVCLTALDEKLEVTGTGKGIQNKTADLIQRGSSPTLASYSMRLRIHEVKDIELEDKFGEIEEKYSSIMPILNEFKEQDEETIINGKVIIEGVLTGSKLVSQNLNFKTINDKKWATNQWLSYTKNQTIPAAIDAENLKIVKLETTKEDIIFDDLFLNNSNAKINGSFNINNLHTNALYVKEINNIRMKDVFMRNRDSMISGMKTFTRLTAGSVEAVNIQNKSSQDVIEGLFAEDHKDSIKFAPLVFIEDLEVEDIDNVNWNTFKHSVFQYGVTTAITGNLKMKNFEADNLDVVSLNAINVEDFMTTSTDQTITSSVNFHHIYATNITANIINGIDLTEMACLRNYPHVKGPVTIEDIHILGNLILNSSLDDSSFLKKNQHIVGTEESDLLQMYTDKVKIIGNLRVKNLRTSQFSSVVLGEEEAKFDPHLQENYWMKNINQIIPSVHVEAQGGITTPHLQTKLLNGNGIFDYLLNNTNKSLPATFAFENVTFLGNIILNDEKIHTPDFQRIDSESVKFNGSFVIQGKKIFNESLKIRHLTTDELNDVKQNQLMTLNSHVEFSGKTMFENLVVNGNFITNEHSCLTLNNIALNQIQDDAIYINKPQDLEALNFTTITVEQFNVKNMNNKPFGKYISETTDMLDTASIGKLIINGKLILGNLLNVSKINEKDPQALYANKLKLDAQGILNGNIKFVENVTIENLSATIINNINFTALTNRLFYKSGNQDIPSQFIFENLKSRNLLAPKINDISVFPQVDIRSPEPQKLYALNGIKFNSATLTVLNSDNISPCNIDVAMEAMISPPTQSWSNMRINGNVTILDEENHLYDIFENVVLTHRKNIIEAPVQFRNISVDNLVAFEHINGINLADIFSDALLKSSDGEQVVTGTNIFERLGVYSATVQNNSDIPVVNGMEISKVSQQIIHKDDVHLIPIRGKKTFFAGLQTVKLQSKTVSNVIPENLVVIDNPQVIPSATFENIEIEENLSVENINNQNFSFFLNERLVVSGPAMQEVSAIYSFNDVHIEGNITTPSINGIEMSDVVFDVSNQEITSKKTFSNDLYVTGNVDIQMLNGYMISDIHHKALLRNQESIINSNVEILKPSVVDGNIITESINGYSLEQMRNILDSETRHHHTEEVDELVKAIEESAIMNYKLVKKMPSEILYLEKSNVVQLSIADTIDAQAFRLRDYVLIHITGEQEGQECGMPRQCKCPVQYTIQISPENSINSFSSKGSQRVYSFDDELMTVHLITDSVSTDLVCRTNSSENERSTLAWTHAMSKNNKAGIYSYSLNFTGYVSAVEYFSLEGITYVIVGKYYDSVANSYDLDCVVFKFSDDRTYVTEIQKIPTSGVWSLKVFYTAQGVNLVIGMLGDGHPLHNFEKTLFMRFNKQQNQFLVLREVQAYGCSSAVGIVQDTEVFIALSHKRHPVLIFKYDPNQDNYIYYQNLWEPLPIRGISIFYTGGFGISDPYLCVVSDRGIYSIYAYEYIEGWQRKFHSEMKGLRNLVPFELNEELYLFAPSINMSSVLTVVKFGSK